MSKHKIAPLKGFPEWLPDQRMVEQRIIDRLRRTFELHGYAPIETRAVEPLEHLLAKGETDKEIYVLRRLHATAEDEDKLGLHFDLTIPFARYVAQNRGQLVFPMRRYQIQKAWRGERPQEGRYREFYQADADVIAENELGLAYDAEMTVLLHEATAALPIPRVIVRVNNRKILEGFYRGVGIEKIGDALRIADKLDKIGPAQVKEQLVTTLGITAESADKCLELAKIRGSDKRVLGEVERLGVRHEILDQGLGELGYLLDQVRHLPTGSVVADLHIARGLDYYTGIVYEGVMEGHESIGSVCSGGRYDDLAGAMGGVKLPGIGVSVGVSRILGRLFGLGELSASRLTPSCVLVALHNDETRDASIAVARTLRARGVPCEVYDRGVKYGRQIRYAEQKKIPYVWFPKAEGAATQHEIRDIRTGAQTAVELETWAPPAEELEISVVPKQPS
ncbi:MAG: histidine--tRNA ligase [Deltaproteobacteria bacterium]|nr:histidine--tRNA ligase [Deltaproteobacteria bacterium]